MHGNEECIKQLAEDYEWMKGLKKIEAEERKWLIKQLKDKR